MLTLCWSSGMNGLQGTSAALPRSRIRFPLTSKRTLCRGSARYMAPCVWIRSAPRRHLEFRNTSTFWGTISCNLIILANICIVWAQSSPLFSQGQDFHWLQREWDKMPKNTVCSLWSSAMPNFTVLWILKKNPATRYCCLVLCYLCTSHNKFLLSVKWVTISWATAETTCISSRSIL